MNPWLTVPFTALLLLAGALASYSPFNQSRAYIVAMCSLGLVGSFTWALCCRWAGADTRTLYSVSMVVDCLTILIYSVLPLLVFKITLSPGAWVGLLLVCIGTLLVKVC